MFNTQFKRLQQFSFLIILSAVSIAFIWVVHDYIMPVFWAVVFAILFSPLQKRIMRYLGKPGIASGVTILIILIVCFVPLFIILGLVFQESVSIYQAFTVSGNISFDFFDRFGQSLHYFEQFGVSELEAKAKLVSYASAGAEWLAGQAISFGQRTFIITLQFFLMLYVLFYMLRDGEKIKKRMIEILPLGDKREKALFDKFISMTRAVIKGTLVVGIIQGAAGGLLFSLVGIQGAVLWGVLMTILAVIPALGTVIVWLPAALILLATGSILPGMIVLIGGALVVSLIDNILRPILVGKDTKIPDVFILISTLGGLSVFGLTGFVIGPVLAGLFIVLWDMFEADYHDDLLRFG